MIEINKNNIIKILHELTTGRYNFKTDTNETLEAVQKSVLLFRKIMGYNALRIEPAYDMVSDDFGNVMKKYIPNVKCLIWTTNEKAPLLTEDELFLERSIERVYQLKIDSHLNVREELFRYSKTIASKFGVRAELKNGFIAFYGNKRISISRSLMTAYANGDSSITFSGETASLQSIRVAVSGFNAMQGTKAKVSASSLGVKVMFRQTPSDEAERLIRTGIDKAISIIGKDEAYLILNKIIESVCDIGNTYRDIEKPEPELPIWKEYGFDTEQKYIEYQENKQRDIEEMKLELYENDQESNECDQESDSDNRQSEEWKDSDMEWK